MTTWNRSESEAPRGLLADERGQFFFVTLGGFLLLTGFFAYLVGGGLALNTRARAQDAADSGTYAMSVNHAHGMNLNSLSNLAKTSIAASLSPLMASAKGAVAALAYIAATWKKNAASAPVVGQIALKIANLLKAATQAHRALSAAQRAQGVLRNRLPAIAEGLALDMLPTWPGTSGGFSWPLRPLATDTGSKAFVCNKARPLSLPSLIKSFLTVPNKDPKALATAVATAALQSLCLGMNVTPFQLPGSTNLGDERLQVRFLPMKRPIPRLLDDLVRVPMLAERPAFDELIRKRDALVSIAVAQGEYYSDAAHELADLCFHPQWRARMTPVRLADIAADGFASACGALGDRAVCAEVERYLPDIARMVVH